jgi:hypothetical protein
MSKPQTPSILDDAAFQNGLALLLGPRQADIMHLF